MSYDLIKKIITEDPTRKRTPISKIVCKNLGWYKPDGKLKDMKLIIPTQLNNAAMNIIVKDVASKYIKEGKIQSGLLNSVEMLIRAYDPCISCATHFLKIIWDKK